MLKKAFKSIYPVFMNLLLALSIAASAGAKDEDDLYDTVELKSGEKVTGTLLTDTFTVMTPYMVVTLEKDKISEIKILPEGKDHDVILLNAGGLVEGTIEELSFLFRLDSGEEITLEKDKCKKIILKSNK
ncbi:MAG: hypothetical protein PVG39_06350 [Desulfobacteraceae bacterium]